MTGPTAYDKTRDPLVGELLPMLQAAANARASSYFAANGIADDIAVRTTAAHPIFANVMPAEGEWPSLSCFVSKSQRKYTTLAHLDHYATLTFQYISPSVAFEDIGARWPVLHLIWRAITDTLQDGFSMAWQGGRRTLDDVGLVRVDLDTAKYDSLFMRGGDYAFPMFSGTVDVVWRDVENWRFTRAGVPLEYVRAQLFVESDPSTGIAPDVVTQVDGTGVDPLSDEAGL